ncbi:MAG: sugar O-acetyltransferase, partial [Parasporobacterium sp.]|nr:sugar O-acetyltransferase [Parasporobacterium sp.]
MTEKEKMIRGEWHDANFDPELLEERSKAESLCYDFNMARPGSEAQLSA